MHRQDHTGWRGCRHGVATGSALSWRSTVHVVQPAAELHLGNNLTRRQPRLLPILLLRFVGKLVGADQADAVRCERLTQPRPPGRVCGRRVTTKNPWRVGASAGSAPAALNRKHLCVGSSPAGSTACKAFSQAK